MEGESLVNSIFYMEVDYITAKTTQRASENQLQYGYKSAYKQRWSLEKNKTFFVKEMNLVEMGLS